MLLWPEEKNERWPHCPAKISVKSKLCWIIWVRTYIGGIVQSSLLKLAYFSTLVSSNISLFHAGLMSRLLQKSLLVMGNCHKFGSSGTKQRSFVTPYTLSEKDNFCRKLCREEGGKFVRQMIVRTLFWQHFFHCTSFFLIYWCNAMCVWSTVL